MKQYYIFLFLFSTSVLAQNNDMLFNKRIKIFEPYKFQVHFKNLSFIRDRAYYNLITDGYTLLGNKADLSFEYFPSFNYSVKAGLQGLKYFGTNKPEYILPYFTLNIYNNNNIFTIGRLYTENNHLLPVFLYDFERMLDNRSLEFGFEHRFSIQHNKNFFKTDTWINWEHFIHKASKERERLNFGIITKINSAIPNNLYIGTSFILLLHHRGGQINLRNSQTNTESMILLNTGGEIDFGYYLSDNSKIGLTSYQFYHYINSDNTEEFHFKKGKAWAGKVYYKLNFFNFSLGYWHSDKFISYQGTPIFKSYSVRTEIYTNNAGEIIPVFKNHTETDRQLIFCDISYKKQILKNLYLAANISGFYQLNKAVIYEPVYNKPTQYQLDYNFGLFISYYFDKILSQKK